MAANESKRIMIVTDYRDVSEMIRRVSHDLGFRDTFAVTDTEKALVKLGEQRQYGLVIADWNVGSSGGLSLLQQMRADEKLKSVQFIMMSANANKPDIIASKTAGANDFIVKPFSMGTLKRKLVAILGT